MKTVKMNCASCGAPLTIPDDVETLVCTSCNSTLSVDRGGGYITLKVIEKLAQSIHEMGAVTTSAIKENAYVTQVELKRMQLNQLISMEEMKINTLQAEIRAVKRRIPANAATPPAMKEELADLVIQENDIRMHIRSLKTDIAHLEPGWEESLDVLKRDGMLLEEAITNLLPFTYIPRVQTRLDAMRKEKCNNEATYDQLEEKLLKKDLTSFDYPSAHLSLEQMEELQSKIPADLSKLKAKPQSKVNLRLQQQLNATLQKIKAVYPRRKVEAQTGKLLSIDYTAPYPEEPAALQPMIRQVKVDLESLSKLEESPERNLFREKLLKQLGVLNSRAAENIPAIRTKKKRTRLIIILAVIGLVITVCLVLFIVGVIASRNKTSQKASGSIAEILQNGISNGPTDQAQPGDTTDGSAQGTAYVEYVSAMVEVTSRTTYLRDAPSTTAKELGKVTRGDLLIDISDSSVPAGWYKVSYMDGSNVGYLASDWVDPFTVQSVPGSALPAHLTTPIYFVDYATPHADWEAENFDDQFARGSRSYIDGAYQLDVTANKDYIYYYINQSVDDLTAQYHFSVDITVSQLDQSSYFGLQINVADELNFDTLLISPDGKVQLIAVRNGNWTQLYETASLGYINVPGGNTLEVTRTLNVSTGSVAYRYAINGKVFAQTVYSEGQQVQSVMGCLVSIDAAKDQAVILMDNFEVSELR